MDGKEAEREQEGLGGGEGEGAADLSACRPLAHPCRSIQGLLGGMLGQGVDGEEGESGCVCGRGVLRGWFGGCGRKRDEGER